MPKQIIYSEEPAYVRDDQGNETRVNQDGATDGPLPGPILRRGVHVGWSRDRYVEVGCAEFTPSTEGHSGGMFLSLDRAGINDLIRALRGKVAPAWYQHAGATPR